MIQWLRQRGESIKAQDWKKVDEINSEIEKAIKHDQVFLDKMQRPCSIFVTFETEEGYENALQLKTKMLGQDISIQPASEPSDIIWENRNISAASRFFKKIVVTIVIVLALAVSFMIIFVC